MPRRPSYPGPSSGKRMPIKISLSASDPLSVAADIVVLGVPEGVSARGGVLGALGKAVGPSVARAIKREEFTGKKDQTIEFVTNGALRPARVVLVGLGNHAALTEA